MIDIEKIDKIRERYMRIMEKRVDLLLLDVGTDSPDFVKYYVLHKIENDITIRLYVKKLLKG